MITVKEKYPVGLKGTLQILKERDVICREDNVITDEVSEFSTLMMSAPTSYQMSHIYGQYGTVIDFPVGTGPFFTPMKTDKVTDLTTSTISIEKAPIIARHNLVVSTSSSTITVIASMMGFPGTQSYVGAGLVCATPTRELLLSHIALNGILKTVDFDLTFVWTWTYTN